MKINEFNKQLLKTIKTLLPQNRSRLWRVAKLVCDNNPKKARGLIASLRVYYDRHSYHSIVERINNDPELQ